MLFSCIELDVSCAWGKTVTILMPTMMYWHVSEYPHAPELVMVCLPDIQWKIPWRRRPPWGLFHYSALSSSWSSWSSSFPPRRPSSTWLPFPVASPRSPPGPLRSLEADQRSRASFHGQQGIIEHASLLFWRCDICVREPQIKWLWLFEACLRNL